MRPGLVSSFALPSAALFGVALALAYLAPASAQETIDCGYPLTAGERSYCADKALSEAETSMTEAANALRKKLVEMDAGLADDLKGSPEALDAAQKAWAVFRETDCKAYAFPFRGTEQGEKFYRSCMIVLTMQRTNDLTATLGDYGN